MTYEICSVCKIKKAVWDYMPGYSSGESPYFCDDCVPRGCSCNHRHCDPSAYHPNLDDFDLPEGIEGVDWKWIDNGNVWTYLDEKGREFPCEEFYWDSEGYPREINPHEI